MEQELTDTQTEALHKAQFKVNCARNGYNSTGAATIYREALSVMEEAGLSQHWYAASLHNMLAEELKYDFEQSVEHALKGIAIYRKLGGAGSSDFQDSMASLLDRYEKRGNFSQAVSFLQDYLPTLEQEDPNAMVLARLRVNLAEYLGKLNQFNQSEEQLLQAMAVFASHFARLSAQMLDLYFRLGQVQLELQKLSDASQSLEKALIAALPSVGLFHTTTAKVIEGLIAVNLELGNRDEAHQQMRILAHIRAAAK